MAKWYIQNKTGEFLKASNEWIDASNEEERLLLNKKSHALAYIKSLGLKDCEVVIHLKVYTNAKEEVESGEKFRSFFKNLFKKTDQTTLSDAYLNKTRRSSVKYISLLNRFLIAIYFGIVVFILNFMIVSLENQVEFSQDISDGIILMMTFLILFGLSLIVMEMRIIRLAFVFLLENLNITEKKATKIMNNFDNSYFGFSMLVHIFAVLIFVTKIFELLGQIIVLSR
ncbi:hypothetical protein RJI07_04815 [Mycoplasmatota bacterium WC30]